jgi:carbon starvation protein
MTSLDSVARVGRIAFQEFFADDTPEAERSSWNRVLTNKYFATIITLILCYTLSRAGYSSIWPLFGSANQLLSALALIACAVFLKKTNRKGFMLWGPMIIMLGVTFTALGFKIKDLIVALSGSFLFGNALQLAFAVLLLLLGVVVAIEGLKKLAAS